MSDFKAIMHQIVCRLGLRPKLRCRSLQRSPKTPCWILGVLLLREGRRGKYGRREEGRGKEGRGTLLSRYIPSHYILDKGIGYNE